MTLITSHTAKGAVVAESSQGVAAKDIVRTNERGMHVLVVPKGQPIPDHVEDVTDEERGEKKKAAKKKGDAAPENKRADG